jgi:O-antigen ligase
LSGVPLVEWLGRIRRGALLALVAGVPLVFLWEVTNLQYDAPKLALLLTGTAVAAAARIGELVLGAPATGLRRAAVPAAFVAVPVAVSWLATGYKEWSLLGAYARYEGLVPVLCVVTAGVLLADASAPAPRVLARTFVASAGVVGVYALVQALGLDPIGEPVVDYSTSTIGHPNFLGGFLAIALPVALGLSSSSSGAERRAALAAAVAIVVGEILSFSQGGWIAAAAGLAAYAGAELAGRHRLARAAGWLTAGALAAAAAGFVLISFVDPFNPLVADTARARGFWWRAAVSMAAESPVWGHGPDVYAIEGPHHRVPEDALAHDTMYADEPHSVPLGRLADTGLLGLAGFVALAVWTVRRGLATRGDALGAGFAAGAAAYFVQSLVSIDTLTLALALWICVAALARAPDREPVRRHVAAGLWRTPVALALVVGATGAAAWWSARYLYTDARVLSANDAYEGRRTDEALETLESVLRTRADNHYRHLYGAMLGSAALREGAEGRDEIERMRAAFAYLDDFPEVRAMADFGDGLHQWSIYDPALEADALEQMQRVLALDESNPTLRIHVAEALIRLGRADDAVETLEHMATLMERFPEHVGPHTKLWSALAITYHYASRADDAGEALLRAEEAAAELGREGDCHFLVASELVSRSGEPATREEYRETSPGLLLCRPATLALLPGFDPQVEDEPAR